MAFQCESIGPKRVFMIYAPEKNLRISRVSVCRRAERRSLPENAASRTIEAQSLRRRSARRVRLTPAHGDATAASASLAAEYRWMCRTVRPHATVKG